MEIDGLKSKSDEAVDFAYQLEFFDPDNFSANSSGEDESKSPETSEHPEDAETPSRPEETDKELQVNTTGLHSFSGGQAILQNGKMVKLQHSDDLWYLVGTASGEFQGFAAHHVGEGNFESARITSDGALCKWDYYSDRDIRVGI